MMRVGLHTHRSLSGLIRRCPKQITCRTLSSDGGDRKHRQQFHGRHFAAFGVGTSLACLGSGLSAKEEPNEENILVTVGERVDGLPEFSMEDVQVHDSAENRVWVTYKSGVYDITDFIPLHPGADKLLMAAGGAVEPFWAMYAVHLNNPVIAQLLEQYRVGNLSEKDVHREKSSDDPYSGDPTRHPALVINKDKPFNAEIPLSIVTDSFLTPNDLFYVRNHLPVPDIEAKSYELEVSGLGVEGETISLTLDQLKQFPKHSIVATVQCAGNRRAEMNEVKNLRGLSWRGGAIGNAEWSGAKVSDVLKAAGFDEEKHPEARHVVLEGLDVDPANTPYAVSIPIEKAADPRGDVLLAYEMNGVTLPRDHGFPIRVVVPGVAGARCVKWLGRLEISENESDGHWQQNDYKGFHASTDWDTVDFTKSESIQDMPVTSAITGCKSSSNDGEMIVSGYAWSGGGRKILRVDLTGDGGQTWTTAESLVQDTARHPRHWGWTLWEGKVKVDPNHGEVWSKAVDSQYNVQPETFENIWNLRGVLSNAYCRFKVST